jgi:hypothetical protein
MRLFIKILLLVFVAFIANVNATNAIVFTNTTNSFLSHKEMTETAFKVIKNDLANCCQNEQGLAGSEATDYPPHTPSNATVRPWEPSWIDKWSMSDNLLLNFSYDIVDGFALMVQAPFSGPTSKHLTGVPAVGNDMINGYASTLMTGLPVSRISKIAGTAAKGGSTLINQGSKAILKNNYYEVNGFKFSKYYYEHLWETGRKAPSLIAGEVLAGGYKTAIPDVAKTGFYKYIYGGWEMVYNPVTKEIWHLQPIK